jgi:hypothetical protein
MSSLTSATASGLRLSAFKNAFEISSVPVPAGRQTRRRATINTRFLAPNGGASNARKRVGGHEHPGVLRLG